MPRDFRRADSSSNHGQNAKDDGQMQSCNHIELKMKDEMVAGAILRLQGEVLLPIVASCPSQWS